MNALQNFSRNIFLLRHAFDSILQIFRFHEKSASEDYADLDHSLMEYQ